MVQLCLHTRVICTGSVTVAGNCPSTHSACSLVMHFMLILSSPSLLFSCVSTCVADHLWLLPATLCPPHSSLRLLPPLPATGFHILPGISTKSLDVSISAKQPQFQALLVLLSRHMNFLKVSFGLNPVQFQKVPLSAEEL